MPGRGVVPAEVLLDAACLLACRHYEIDQLVVNELLLARACADAGDDRERHVGVLFARVIALARKSIYIC